ncbi:hypothetical protein NONI108955_12440 [Nocardia ninae]
MRDRAPHRNDARTGTRWLNLACRGGGLRLLVRPSPFVTSVGGVVATLQSYRGACVVVLQVHAFGSTTAEADELGFVNSGGVGVTGTSWRDLRPDRASSATHPRTTATGLNSRARMRPLRVVGRGGQSWISGAGVGAWVVERVGALDAVAGPLVQRRDYEVKYDGIRAAAYVSDTLKLISRNGNEVTGSFPEVAAALIRSVGVQLVAFDVLEYQGRSLIGMPYVARREILDDLALSGRLVLTPPYWTVDATPCSTWPASTTRGHRVQAPRFRLSTRPPLPAVDQIGAAQDDGSCCGRLDSNQRRPTRKRRIVGAGSLRRGFGIRLCGPCRHGFHSCDAPGAARTARRARSTRQPLRSRAGPGPRRPLGHAPPRRVRGVSGVLRHDSRRKCRTPVWDQ